MNEQTALQHLGIVCGMLGKNVDCSSLHAVSCLLHPPQPGNHGSSYAIPPNHAFADSRLYLSSLLFG